MKKSPCNSSMGMVAVQEESITMIKRASRGITGGESGLAWAGRKRSPEELMSELKAAAG